MNPKYSRLHGMEQSNVKNWRQIKYHMLSGNVGALPGLLDSVTVCKSFLTPDIAQILL